MNHEELIEDFDHRTVNTKRIIKFDLLYKGIEVEGTYTEYMNDFGGSWDREVVIEENENLTDEDMDYIEDYVKDKL
jgi:hypothetical protein